MMLEPSVVCLSSEDLETLTAAYNQIRLPCIHRASHNPEDGSNIVYMFTVVLT